MTVPIPAAYDFARRLCVTHAAKGRLTEKLGQFLLQVLGVRGDSFLVILDLFVPRLGLGPILDVLGADRNRVSLVGEHQGKRGRLVLVRKEGTGIRPAFEQAVVFLRVKAIAGVIGRLRLLRPIEATGDRLGIIVPEVRIGEQLKADGLVDLLDRHIGRRQTRRQETEH